MSENITNGDSIGSMTYSEVLIEIRQAKQEVYDKLIHLMTITEMERNWNNSFEEIVLELKKEDLGG